MDGILQFTPTGAPGWAPTAPPASNLYGAVYCWLHNKVANTYDLLPGM